jgi:phage gp36-like protein
MTAFATGSDLIARYDVRTIGDLVNDDGTAANSGTITGGGNAVINAALEDASGEILAALRQAGRYTEADLTGLTGNSLAHLKRITCKIAFWHLWERRASWDDDERADAARSDARRALQDLRQGVTIFDLTAPVGAGTPSVSVPTVLEIRQSNLLVDRVRDGGGMYPRRQYPRT